MTRIAPCLILLLLAASPGALADSWRAHGHYARGFDYRFTSHGDYWRDSYLARSRWDRGRSFGYPQRGNFVHLAVGSWDGHPRYRYNRPYSRGFYRGYNRGFNRGYNRGFKRGRHWGYGDNDAAVLVGGVVLGSLLTQTFSSQHTSYRAAPVVTRRVVRSNPVRTVSQTTVTRETRRQHRSYLLRDLQGDCYEVERDSGGTEIRTQVAVEHCEY